ncbi:MAG: bifunctional ornithine acetyltransferase/N-acetylglutamate synthase, partial [Nitrospirae bacterium]|nr:bifunctional ornithine acetyltransferase/N-acetylglutamate synthase [Fimbriimonadaceae bacterium]
NSPLVKTAMFGCDPNWGRILAAAGRSGVAFEPTLATLTLAASGRRHLLCRNGTPQTFDAAEASQDLKAESVRIELDLGPGEEAVVYTCDFGYGYVRINAEYHT